MNEDFSSYYQDNSPQSAPPQGYPPQGSPYQGYPPQGSPYQGSPQPQIQQGNKKTKTIIISVIAVMAIVGSVFFILWLMGILRSETMDRDAFAKYNWYETNDGSYLVPESNGEFSYYKDKGVEDDNYFTGTYEYYIGEFAIDYVVKDLSKYGVTRADIEEMISNNEQYKEENFVCIVLHNKHAVADGDEMLKDTIDTPYFGFQLYKRGKYVLDIANMNTATYYWFQEDAK